MTLADDRRIAEEATPGPWETLCDRAPARDFRTGAVLPDIDAPLWKTTRVVDGERRLLVRIEADPEQVLTPQDAAFIAHFDPAYVSKLLDVVEAAQQATATLGSQRPEIAALEEALAALVGGSE